MFLKKRTIPEKDSVLRLDQESDRWCIIGGGFAGITMASRFQQSGIPFVIYEQDTKIGGNWQQGTYSGVHTISSKKITEISDFPFPEDYPDFPSAEQIREYLNNYVKHFELTDHFKFGHLVTKIHPILDGRQWEVTANGKTIKYKGVIICNGHDWDPFIPKYAGNPTLETLHTRYYKNSKILEGKRVLTIGAGNSGTDVACDAARFAVKSGISMRRGYWFVPRMLFGKPTFERFPFWLPTYFQQLYIKFGFWCMYGKLADYGLPKPDHDIYDHHLSITDQIFHEIRKGRLYVYPEVKSIDGKIVTFIDGRQEEFDLVIYATGYRNSFPMAEHLIEYKDGIAQLIHGVVHPHLKNFYVLGFGFARSGAGPLLYAAARTIRRSIYMQDKITFPIGRVFVKTGSRIPKKGKHSKDIIIDPYKAFGKEFLGRIWLPTVPFFEKLLLNPSKYDPKIIQEKYKDKKL